MKVQFIRERSLPFVGPAGVGTRIFAIGETVELPEVHAQSYIADGDAIVAREKPAKAETPAPHPAKAAKAAEAPKPAAKPSK